MSRKNKTSKEIGSSIKTVKISSKSEEFGIIRSSLNFPQLIIYRGENCFVPPSGKLDNVKKSDISFPLPVGIKFISK